MVHIGERGPLPDHTVYNFWECYAKLILEHYYPDVFKDIQLIDKPDLYCKYNDTGIEVVKCDEQKKEEAVNLWAKMNTFNEEEKKRAIERMKQLGFEYQGWLQTWPPKTFNGVNSKPYIPFFNAIRIKLNKINQRKYKNCSHYCLFAISEDIYMPKVYCKEVLDYIINITSKFEMNFDHVFLQSEQDFIDFNLISNSFNHINMGFTQRELSEASRQMVIDKEKEVHPEDFGSPKNRS